MARDKITLAIFILLPFQNIVYITYFHIQHSFMVAKKINYEKIATSFRRK
jgi:hypothetical protein